MHKSVTIIYKYCYESLTITWLLQTSKLTTLPRYNSHLLATTLHLWFKLF